MFELHPRLAQDSVCIGEFELSLILLSKDANYPWCILVPKRASICEIHQLDDVDQLQLIRESSRLSNVMMDLFSADKMNVAALGNIVRQLHIHHVARFTDDPAWPQPIWGKLAAKEYDDQVFTSRIYELQNALKGAGFSAR